MIPSLRELPALPVTAGICLLGVVIYLFAGVEGIDHLTLDLRAFEGQSWRVLTTAFVHGGVWGHESATTGGLHLAFNAYWLLFLAPPLERRWGSFRFAVFVIAAATVSSLAEYALLATPVGLSGVVYACAGARARLQRDDPEFEPKIEARIFSFLAFWFVFCIALSLADLLPVANVAHGVGALMGIGMAALDTGIGRRRILAGLALLSSLVVYPAAAPNVRTQLNLAPVQGEMELFLAGQARRAGETEAERRYVEACMAYPRCPLHNAG